MIVAPSVCLADIGTAVDTALESLAVHEVALTQSSVHEGLKVAADVDSVDETSAEELAPGFLQIDFLAPGMPGNRKRSKVM